MYQKCPFETFYGLYNTLKASKTSTPNAANIYRNRSTKTPICDGQSGHGSFNLAIDGCFGTRHRHVTPCLVLNERPIVFRPPIHCDGCTHTHRWTRPRTRLTPCLVLRERRSGVSNTLARVSSEKSDCSNVSTPLISSRTSIYTVSNPVSRPV